MISLYVFYPDSKNKVSGSEADLLFTLKISLHYASFYPLGDAMRADITSHI